MRQKEGESVHLLLLEEGTLVLLGLRDWLLEESIVNRGWDRDTGHIHSGGGGDDVGLWNATERDTVKGVWACKSREEG